MGHSMMIDSGRKSEFLKKTEINGKSGIISLSSDQNCIFNIENLAPSSVKGIRDQYIETFSKFYTRKKCTALRIFRNL